MNETQTETAYAREQFFAAMRRGMPEVAKAWQDRLQELELAHCQALVDRNLAAYRSGLLGTGGGQ